MKTATHCAVCYLHPLILPSNLHAVMSIQSVKAFFQQLDLNLPIIELEVSTATVALAAEAHGVEPGQIAKTLAFRLNDDRVLLVNANGDSVAKIVNLPYPIVDPSDGSTVLTQAYPNSLVDMRNQMIDQVGQISTKLPLWMTSKQANGRVLGFTPAWVICYTKPGRSNQIAYYINRYYGEQLNKVDFGVDRYIIDRTLSRNWDTDTQRWTPAASLTTFDRFNTGGNNFVKCYIATTLPNPGHTVRAGICRCDDN